MTRVYALGVSNNPGLHSRDTRTAAFKVLHRASESRRLPQESRDEAKAGARRIWAHAGSQH